MKIPSFPFNQRLGKMHRGIIRHLDSIKYVFNQFGIVLIFFWKFRNELGKLGNLGLVRPYAVGFAQIRYIFN